MVQRYFHWRLLGTMALLVGLAFLSSCGDEGDDSQSTQDVVAGDTQLDLDPALQNLGTVHVIGNYEGDYPENAEVAVVLFNCPFSMPPVAYATNPVEDGFPFETDLVYVPPGHYCVMAYLDMIPGDSTHPIPGVDADAFPAEGQSSIEVDVEAGKVTNLELSFEMSQETEITGDPGPDDVWLHVRILCDDCPEGGRFVLYGKNGESLDGMPEYYLEKANPVFPFITVVPASNFLGMETLFPADTTITFGAYHDVDSQGMGPEEGEPVAPSITVKLVAGMLNKLVFRLEK